MSSFLQGVDLIDGGKIIGHLLGLNNNNALSMISQQTGVNNQNTGNILAAAAPLLMSLLGQQLGSNNANASPSLLSSNATNMMQGLDMASLLTGLLGGTQQAKPQQKPSLLGSLLGGLFGR